MSSSRERIIRKATDELMNLRDALGIGDDRDDVIVMASNFFRIALDHNFTKGRSKELVFSSCLYLTCRQFKLAVLLIDFSSYLRVSVYDLGSVYLQLCDMLYITENHNYEKLVDPSIFIPRFSNMLLKGAHNNKLVLTATHIIASMKRDWMQVCVTPPVTYMLFVLRVLFILLWLCVNVALQTGRKPSGICGAALYTAALSHGIKCSKTDIVNIVHICEATLTKRLIEFGDTEAASLTADELSKTEREKETAALRSKRKPNFYKEGVVLCMHQDCKPVDYGLCESCYDEFMTVSGGLEGGSDPPAFQRAEKERMEEKASSEENDKQVNLDGHSDESSTLSDVDDRELDCYFRTPEEVRLVKIFFDHENPGYDEKEAAKKAAGLNACNNASNIFEASKAAAAKSRKEKRQQRAEEEKNAPPPATGIEAVDSMVKRKKFRDINCDYLEELFDASVEKSPKRSKTETVMEKKKKEEHEIVENEQEEEDYAAPYEQDEEDYAAPYEMNTDKKFYESEVEEEEDGYDFGLY
jgi:transcription factor IIIB subunit 2